MRLAKDVRHQPLDSGLESGLYGQVENGSAIIGAVNLCVRYDEAAIDYTVYHPWTLFHGGTTPSRIFHWIFVCMAGIVFPEYHTI